MIKCAGKLSFGYLTLIDQSFPTFFDAFLPLLILEHFIPALWNVHSSPVRVRRLVLTTMGAMVFIEDISLIDKSGTKTIYQIMAIKCVKKRVVVTNTK